jgi:hypothetical protein
MSDSRTPKAGSTDTERHEEARPDALRDPTDRHWTAQADGKPADGSRIADAETGPGSVHGSSVRDSLLGTWNEGRPSGTPGPAAHARWGAFWRRFAWWRGSVMRSCAGSGTVDVVRFIGVSEKRDGLRRDPIRRASHFHAICGDRHIYGPPFEELPKSIRRPAPRAMSALATRGKCAGFGRSTQYFRALFVRTDGSC